VTAKEIINLLESRLTDAIDASVPDGMHPHIRVKPDRLIGLCTFLKEDPALRFDLLRCITAVDYPQRNEIELSYDLVSIPHVHAIAVKVSLDRVDPRIESASGIWAAAEWHEREAWDMMGVKFLNHPDPRRILMPEDWTGHPLRKDYQDPAEYHGWEIKP